MVYGVKALDYPKPVNANKEVFVAEEAKGRKKGTLTKEQVVRAALLLINEAGPDGCSMRALGAKLGVSAMAVYGYVSSREALLNEACALFLSRIDTRAVPGELWEDTLLRTMHSLRNACQAHPHVAQLLNDPLVGEGLEPYMMRLRALFLAQGMPEEIAIQLVAITDSFFAGFVLRSKQRVEREQEKKDAPRGSSQGDADAVQPASFAAVSRVPGLLTGRREPALRPNERWRKSVAAGYSARSFENGLFVIIEGIRAGASPDPCNWRTPAK